MATTLSCNISLISQLWTVSLVQSDSGLEIVRWCLIANNSVANTSLGTWLTARDLSRAGLRGDHLPGASLGSSTKTHVPKHQSSSDAEECYRRVWLAVTRNPWEVVEKGNQSAASNPRAFSQPSGYQAEISEVVSLGRRYWTGGNLA
ncbi:hypothetical protein QBC45DRAFT_429008 [Copromyces sp. CBS 386.78]|nr:hypothetical protein QBC45DRAFT_429008 [Copromyces sp. CBS 386.78]